VKISITNTVVSVNQMDKAPSIKIFEGYYPDFKSTEAPLIQGEAEIY
jgi:hypothetical protein